MLPFRFPKDEIVRKAWIMAVRRRNWEPSPHSVVCSLHFEEHCIDRSKNRITIHEGSVPTLFPTHTVSSYYQDLTVSNTM